MGGLSRGDGELLGVCDAHGNLLDGEGFPAGAQEAHDAVAQTWDRYRARLP
jgi:hypothetical protein